LWNGLSGLGTIIVLMVPPSPGELWVEILKGMAESVAMAFLGTAMAAVVAVPLGLLGCRFAVLPQVLPNLISYLLLRFEVNIRSASVIGFVGAGGIGEELYKVISFNYYEEVSAIVVLIILTVSVLDLLSERLRHAAIGRLEAAR
ncbi:MAG TPA: ABC transporter permease subunit, partial [Roseomonas sp.]|nr:ABC transporter permease subunit [Roseomonas sp.]